MADGTLIDSVKSDPSFSRYGANVTDDAHQRTFAADLLLSIFKSVVQRRTKLQITIAFPAIDTLMDISSNLSLLRDQYDCSLVVDVVSKLVYTAGRLEDDEHLSMLIRRVQNV